jgi:hypothetical protein
LLESHLELPGEDLVRTCNFKAAFAQPGDDNNDDAHTESIDDDDDDDDNDDEHAVASRGIGSVHGMRKEALIMGLNYIGQHGQLSGCIADTHTWRDYLTKQCGINALLCMTDRTHIRPTRSNMVRMVARLKRAGGTLFFTYSGHGSQVRNYGHGTRRDAESDGKD